MGGVADTTSDTAARRELAAAKINLFLHVGSRGTDGYHALESLVVFSAFGDHLQLAPSDSFELARTGPYAIELPDRSDEDLTARAVAGLAAICGRASAFKITLEKNIPVAAGLGGGSADAAAAIRLVCREWGVDPDDPRVLALAEGLGADVPMCLHSRPAWIAGAGEQVTPVSNCADLDLLLVNPRVPLSTAQVFGAYAPADPVVDSDLASADVATPASVLAFLGRQSNDLTGPAQGLCPVISDVLETLAHARGCQLARMSGSGPTCFAIFDNEEACKAAARDIGARHPDWWMRSTRTGHSTR
ncbi:MAG: 4-(cytidine 5'-diphospho)-2-C-methyl-D-erythritol kinase [Rhodospirillaceae bacterium]|nr:4-(cytidine 5'-diphospho)-2-C-methyl-D-erythritol kinase [Rhodospirillaceae bacterium]MBT3932560.1 4-(cytidine 5'-diphospho)-2-C-methyl-D-erythritol kinase [Rhodospirillaceae bacterium]MBT4772940.1 4-(cytidine 5'-diphospho)-2-C-methyl-D-erythritol kinase [Rhodospirillaceae bacterium]MBT5358306.1 4-(cytidine 5'-diphospho)-2-C-methyl-D-erythritol kinase [Rhodospirillaceae bacterium]MBT5767921.1 4-(cytidine 5'-diphospho)-2-C-methyl-D-erythritol kinase [Rhodospirillaceae bacterium]